MKLVIYAYCMTCRGTTGYEEIGPRLRGKVLVRCQICQTTGDYTFADTAKSEAAVQERRAREAAEFAESYEATILAWQDYHCDRLGLTRPADLDEQEPLSPQEEDNLARWVGRCNRTATS